MDDMFFELFLFVYYYNIVFEKLVFEKLVDPNRAEDTHEKL